MGKITEAISKTFITLIRAYKFFISPMLGNCCRFYPSCSSYAIEAINAFGYLRGCYLILKRVLRCQPWSKGGYDPIPETKLHANQND